MLIDSHQHFWTLNRSDYGWLTSDLTALYRDFSPQDLIKELEPLPITHSICVQAAPTVEETRYLLNLADSQSNVIGVVGWIDFESDTAIPSLEVLLTNPKFIGVRPMIQDIEDEEWILSPQFSSVFNALIEHQLTFDTLVFPRHLKHIIHIANTYPNLTIVLNHSAKPNIAQEKFSSWANDISALAQYPNVFCKISGLVTEANPDWTADDLAPYIEHVTSSFGYDRILWGSDWPVCLLVSSYEQWYQASQSILDLSSYHLHKMLNKNVFRAYPKLTHAINPPY
ncbi:amidohydrolase [Vibrio amylolyticus]|uniref:amidohydrolase family protein n=1 Tax=Vibrio amylolyticus TaxID=2847292 RepID=UPI003550C070